MDEAVEVDEEGLQIWGFDKSKYLECEDHGLELYDAVATLVYLHPLLNLFNDPKCIRHHEIHDLLYAQVREAFWNNRQEWINQFKDCLEIVPKTDYFLDWQCYVKRFLYYDSKNSPISEKESYDLAKLLIIRKYSYAPNNKFGEFRFTGKTICGFKEMQCETYRIHPLDNQIVGFDEGFLYFDLKHAQWLYSSNELLDDMSFTQKYNKSLKQDK